MNGVANSVVPRPTPQTLVRLARTRIEHNDHFAGHLESVEVTYCEGSVVLSGRVPSFYLKSVLQTAVGPLPAGCRVENRVDVVCCGGLSSPSPSRD
ncbi:hypothetical protein Pla123a_33730 [Posidoniimonas polymericola]|uniref:BON domain protein n=1 Tax=Posidoniimonas polymericola TaxID=2528002 RepID=A0A5C5YHA3_9BACT|nr:hypothetical protein [Posidoniimonas polymericola]TWT74549.1 hypothetical protein Pla123a_33730 [Posidoniimonas polymericola]